MTSLLQYHPRLFIIKRQLSTSKSCPRVDIKPPLNALEDRIWNARQIGEKRDRTIPTERGRRTRIGSIESQPMYYAFVNTRAIAFSAMLVYRSLASSPGGLTLGDARLCCIAGCGRTILMRCVFIAPPGTTRTTTLSFTTLLLDGGWCRLLLALILASGHRRRGSVNQHRAFSNIYLILYQHHTSFSNCSCYSNSTINLSTSVVSPLKFFNIVMSTMMFHQHYSLRVFIRRVSRLDSRALWVVSFYI